MSTEHSSGKPAGLRMGITSKLVAWCMLLLVVFIADTTFLIVKIRSIETLSGRIATVHAVVADRTDDMIGRLISAEENRKRYEILRKDEYSAFFRAEIEAYSGLLAEVLALGQEETAAWGGLRDRLLDALRRGAQEDEAWRLREAEGAKDVGEGAGAPEGQPAKGAAKNSAGTAPKAAVQPPEPPMRPLHPASEEVNAWLQTLRELRDQSRARIGADLRRLHQRGAEAERVGYFAVSFSVALGLLGSLFIAWMLNRSLRELKRGIRRIGKESQLEPVRVLSGDELGELAVAFNNMTERLRAEEQMRADFISMLSHEIRTPLTSIREAVQLVGSGALGEIGERQARFLGIAGKEVDRLSRLLARLMQVSSMESGQLDLAPAPSDPLELAAGAVDALQPSAAAKQVRLTVSSASGLPPVLADAENIRQVLLNLVGNAVKFSPEGSRVDVRIYRMEDDDGVTFCVDDEGPGIPPAERSQVFLKYYRGAGVKDKIDGAGLGLSISKRIVEAHGGSMWIEDKPAPGSRFCFLLPRAGASE